MGPAIAVGAAVAALTTGEPPGPDPPTIAAGASAADGGREAKPVRRVVTGRSAEPRPKGPAQPLGERPGRPARIVVRELGLDVPTVPVGATDDGIRVPPVDEAGWYRSGPRPGEPGRAIVLGHLDSLDGPAAFTLLPDAKPGMVIEVVDRAGKPQRFEVTRVREVPKSRFPAEAVYGVTRRPLLAVITCGGEFDPESGYENNVIVFARLQRPDPQRTDQGKPKRPDRGEGKKNGRRSANPPRS